MITVAAPTRVWQRLTAAPDGPCEVVHAGHLALYVDLDGGPSGCLGLVARPATRVPCAVWSNLPSLAHLSGRPVHVVDGTLVVGDEPVRVTRLVDVRLPAPVLPVGRPDERSPWQRLPMTSALGALPPDGRLTPVDVAHLVGRGPGLTPLGDDVLAGWLAVRAAAGAPDDTVEAAVRQALTSTTPLPTTLLSATLLDCALRGEALPQLATWVAALGTPAETVAESAVLAVGASSGAGLLTGARLALRSLVAVGAAPPDRPTTGHPTTSHPRRVA